MAKLGFNFKLPFIVANYAGKRCRIVYTFGKFGSATKADKYMCYPVFVDLETNNVLPYISSSYTNESLPDSAFEPANFKAYKSLGYCLLLCIPLALFYIIYCLIRYYKPYAFKKWFK